MMLFYCRHYSQNGFPIKNVQSEAYSNKIRIVRFDHFRNDLETFLSSWDTEWFREGGEQLNDARIGMLPSGSRSHFFLLLSQYCSGCQIFDLDKDRRMLLLHHTMIESIIRGQISVFSTKISNMLVVGIHFQLSDTQGIGINEFTFTDVNYFDNISVGNMIFLM